jgi:hypothetical protein
MDVLNYIPTLSSELPFDHMPRNMLACYFKNKMENIPNIILNTDIEQLATSQLKPAQLLLQFQPPGRHIVVLLRKLHTNLMPVRFVNAEIRIKE